MVLLDFASIALAATAVIDVWQHGSIFAELREYIKTRVDGILTGTDDPEGAGGTDDEDETPGWMKFLDRWLPDLFARLLDCPFCMSYWVPAVLLILFFVPSLWLPQPWSVVCMLPVHALAATAIGHVLLPAGDKE